MNLRHKIVQNYFSLGLELFTINFLCIGIYFTSASEAFLFARVAALAVRIVVLIVLVAMLAIPLMSLPLMSMSLT